MASVGRSNLDLCALASFMPNLYQPAVKKFSDISEIDARFQEPARDPQEFALSLPGARSQII
jgi:hypothetical protein